MDKIIADITAYSQAIGQKPEWVLRQAIGAGWGTWERWKSRKSAGPTVATTERLYAYIAANPAPAPTPAGDAA